MNLSLKIIKKLDKKNMYSSIESLHLQCQQVLKENNKIKLPKNYKNINQIVISGMGASILGGHIIKSLYYNSLNIPINLVSGYFLPAYVNSKTLCIISSYSGNTEETLATFKEAQKKKAKIFIITSGGQLKKYAKKNKIPNYIFNPKYNYCNEPRIGLGYSILGQIIILKKIGLIKIKEKELKQIIETIKNFSNKFKITQQKNNIALKIASKLQKKIPIIIGSKILMGNVHTFNNQINENAKTFSTWMELPDINHHLLEGLKNPNSNIKNLIFFFLKSNLYYKRNKIRYTITQKIIKKNRIDYMEYSCQAKTKLNQSFEFLILGSFVSFYLAMFNKLNPSPVPFVNFFKKEINKIN